MLYDKVALPFQGITLVEYLHSTSLASYTLRVTDINTYNGPLVNNIHTNPSFPTGTAYGPSHSAIVQGCRKLRAVQPAQP